MRDATAKRTPELLFAVFLIGVGIVVGLNATTLHTRTSTADPVGPAAVPFVVCGMLVITGIALIATVLRGHLTRGDDGEDVDLSHPSDWSTLLPLLGVFVLTIVLIDWAGWVIAGTLLFFGSVVALGGRRWLLTLVISVLLALGTFYGFYVGLGIKLPAGFLQGVL